MPADTHALTITNDTLIRRITTGLRDLPTPLVRLVLDFTEYLGARYEMLHSPVGSAGAVLASWGAWQLDEKERVELETYIEMVREMPDDRIPA